MKEIKEKIEQIMQQFNDKREVIEGLINANKKEELAIKTKLADLKKQRLDEKKELKLKEEQLNEKKKSLLLDQNVSDSDIIINGMLIPKQSEEEKKLIDEIEKMNEKEREIVCLRNIVSSLNSNKETLMQEFLSGIEEYANVMRISSESIYKEEETKLFSRISVLTKELEQKPLLEQKLKQLRLNMDMDTSKSTIEQINSSHIQKSLELFFCSKEQEFSRRKEELRKETAEEKELKKELKEIEKRPNYTRVYLREMFETKYEYQSLIAPEKIQVEILLNSKVTEKETIRSQVEEAKKDKLEALERIKKERDDIASQIRGLKSTVNIDKYEVTTDGIYKELSDKLVSLGRIAIPLEEEINKIHADTTDLDNEIKEIQTILEEINKSCELLNMTTEEAMTCSISFTEIEQAEYNRRLIIRNQEKIQKQKQVEEYYKQQSIDYEKNESIEGNELPKETFENGLDYKSIKDASVDQIMSELSKNKKTENVLASPIPKSNFDIIGEIKNVQAVNEASDPNPFEVSIEGLVNPTNVPNISSNDYSQPEDEEMCDIDLGNIMNKFLTSTSDTPISPDEDDVTTYIPERERRKKEKNIDEGKHNFKDFFRSIIEGLDEEGIEFVDLDTPKAKKN